MNKQRRGQIANIIKKLQSISAELSDVLSEEELVFDNMPENLQGSMRGEESEEAIDIMSEALDGIEEICGNLESI